jgi:hypothetical protein
MVTQILIAVEVFYIIASYTELIHYYTHVYYKQAPGSMLA